MGIDVYNSCLGDPSGTVDGFGGLPEHFPVSQPGWFAGLGSLSVMDENK